MANLQFNGTDFTVKYKDGPEKPIPLPTEGAQQMFQDQINAAAHYGQSWLTRQPFLAANSAWGGDGDFQRPNGAWPATADPHGTTDGRPNFDGLATPLANVTYGAQAAAGIPLDDAKTGAGFFNLFSTDSDKSGTDGLNSNREAEIDAGYAGYGRQYSADNSTPLSKIQSMAGDDVANLPGVAAGAAKAGAGKVEAGAAGAAKWLGDRWDDGVSAVKGEINDLTTPPAAAPPPDEGSSAAPADSGATTAADDTAPDDDILAGAGQSQDDDDAPLTDQDEADLTPNFASWGSLMNGGDSGLADA